MIFLQTLMTGRQAGVAFSQLLHVLGRGLVMVRGHCGRRRGRQDESGERRVGVARDSHFLQITHEIRSQTEPVVFLFRCSNALNYI
jgi:hypothetical protein